ncbi:MAG: ribonuclease H-like domain-containing protein [Acidobacteriaceae bacterium]|nr:ribonuclease H-like domain-containing protein [Acidobacteriaceae bacterium]
MIDPAEQLAQLKQRIAAIDARYAGRKPVLAQARPVVEHKWMRSFVDEWSQGEVVTNDFGQHFQTERLFPPHKRHGSSDVSALIDLPRDLLDALGAGCIPDAAPERWAFLDTETSGLVDGPGTYAFLTGIGRITRDGFRIRQFFMREYAEERSVLAAVEEHLKNFDVLITYNGKSYDQPLLEMRYRMSRIPSPFARLSHLDILHGARSLWKLRFENCRLIELEQRVLGVEREGDLPGELIPYVYFEYLRSRHAQRLVPIFHHNAMDILTLACLTAIVPAAFRSTETDSLARLGVRRGEDLAGIARWLLAAGEEEQGLQLLKRAVAVGLPDPLLFKTLWDIASYEKKLARADAALSALGELAQCRNEYRVNALVELAKYYEHEQRNYAQALEFTNQALSHEPGPALLERKARLERRLARPPARERSKSRVRQT